MPRRIYLENSTTREIFEFPKVEEINIGRAPENNYVLPDPKVSRLHCILQRYDLKDTTEMQDDLSSVLTVIDMGSKNKTYVNKEKIPGDKETKVPLYNNDVLTIGPYELIVRILEYKSIIKTTSK